MKRKLTYSLCLIILSVFLILNYSNILKADDGVEKIQIQSASAGTVSGGTINLANTYDGNPATMSNVSFNPIGGPQAYYTYDLGEVYDLSRVYINFSTSRAHFYKIMVSNNGVNFSLAYEKLSGVYDPTNINGTNYFVQDVNLESVQARYIKIICHATAAQAATGSHGAWYQLAEIEFYGNRASIINPDPVGQKLDIVTATSGTPQTGTIVITRTYDEYLNLFTDVQWTPIGGPQAYYTYDLGKVCDITRVHLNFDTVRANFYKVQVSIDGVNFTTAYENLGDDYGTTNINGVEYYVEEFDLVDIKGRYIKIIPYATTRQAYDGVSGEWARLNEVVFYGGLHKEIAYAGSEIRTSLVPAKTDQGTYDDKDLRQGLRLSYVVDQVGESIIINGVEHLVKAQGALVMLKEKADTLGLENMIVENVGIIEKLVNQTELLDRIIGDKVYKSAYVYNIPFGQRHTVISVRGYIKCVSVVDSSVQYIYSPLVEDSIWSVYNRLPAEIFETLEPEVIGWFS